MLLSPPAADAVSVLPPFFPLFVSMRAGHPVRAEQPRRGVPSRLEARRQDHEARPQGQQGVLRSHLKRYNNCYSVVMTILWRLASGAADVAVGAAAMLAGGCIEEICAAHAPVS